MADRREPPRFRRRLTAAFVAVASASAGVLALVTAGISQEYRTSTFRARALDEARLALTVAPSDLESGAPERLLAAYEVRTGADVVARSATGTYASSTSFSLTDIPTNLRSPSGDALVTHEAQIKGTRRLVVGGQRGGVAYWFIFSMDPLGESVADFRAVLLIGWLATTVLAATVGWLVARRTLRPVAAAAEAARAIAAGHLDTRLQVRGDDEFGRWTKAFNGMADELGATIEQLRETAERERLMMADLAHELRTPLTGMAAAGSLLREDIAELPPATARAATVLIRDVDRLNGLVLELLELARLDAGSEPVEVEVLDAASSLRAIAAVYADRATVEVDAAEGIGLIAQRSRLRRVLTNLVDNALAHGRAPVRLSARRVGSEVEVTVLDSGPGIRPGEAEALFRRFTKASPSRSASGPGLGLSIAQAHATAMHGRLSVASNEGGGALFVLHLPAAEHDA